MNSPLYTNPFKVFSPKQFPGMLGMIPIATRRAFELTLHLFLLAVSSELSIYLFQNGVSIRRREYNFSEAAKENSSLSSSSSIKIIPTPSAEEIDVVESPQDPDPTTPNEALLSRDDDEEEVEDDSSDETMLNRKSVAVSKLPSPPAATTNANVTF